MKSDLEARLLASVASVQDFHRLKEIGLDEEAFEHYKPMYDYIDRQLKRNGKVPRLLDLRETFNLPDTVKRTRDEFDYVLHEAEQLIMTQNIQTVLDKSVEEHSEEPNALIDNIVRDLSGMRSVSSTQVSSTDSSMLTRLARYEAQAHVKGARGLRTGLKYFDEEWRLGWLPGELVGIVGRTYVGKSWLLLFFGLMAWQFGKRIVFVSPEMSIEETEARFDGLLMGKNDIKVSVSELYRGYVPTDEMKTLAEEVAMRKNWLTYACADDGRFGLAQLAQLAWQHKPDMLLIDGLPLLESEGSRRQQVWESIKDLSYGLKNLAVRHNLAVLVSHQATRRAHNVARPPGLHEIAYGDAFAQACDRVLALSRPQETEDSLRITIQKFRRGRPHLKGIDFMFDPERGEIHEYIPTDARGSGRPRDEGDGEGTGDTVSLP